jgi:hypothetical protein
MKQRWLLVEALKAGFPSAKHLAMAGGISVNTAERYRRGETYPDVFTTARLMRSSRLVADAMLRMAGLDDLSLDLEHRRLVQELADLEAKRAVRHEVLAAAYAAAGVVPPPEIAALIGPKRGKAATADPSPGGAVAPVRMR